MQSIFAPANEALPFPPNPSFFPTSHSRYGAFSCACPSGTVSFCKAQEENCSVLDAIFFPPLPAGSTSPDAAPLLWRFLGSPHVSGPVLNCRSRYSLVSRAFNSAIFMHFSSTISPRGSNTGCSNLHHVTPWAQMFWQTSLSFFSLYTTIVVCRAAVLVTQLRKKHPKIHVLLSFFPGPLLQVCSTGYSSSLRAKFKIQGDRSSSK